MTKGIPAVKKGNTRVTGREQFYTPPSDAHAVVGRVLALRPALVNRLWVEPCGGTGKFLDAYAQVGVARAWSCDIEPHDSRVLLRDFLASPPTPVEVPGLAGAVVATNPPFGRNNALSVPFFNTAARFAEVIAFIVPRSWRKWSVQNRLDRHFWLIDDSDLVVDYDNRAGAKIAANGNLRTCVQVWERRAELRPLYGAPDRGYVVKTGPLEADVALTIFGHSCGNLRTEFPRVPNTTSMFLRVRDARVIEALIGVDFSRFYNNVAYTEALSLPEINCLLNEWFDAHPE